MLHCNCYIVTIFYYLHNAPLFKLYAMIPSSTMTKNANNTTAKSKTFIKNLLFNLNVIESDIFLIDVTVIKCAIKTHFATIPY